MKEDTWDRLDICALKWYRQLPHKEWDKPCMLLVRLLLREKLTNLIMSLEMRDTHMVGKRNRVGLKVLQLDMKRESSAYRIWNYTI
ncbi:hypothetical protein NDU88_003921 [Pleurodeles waltl]|uniref:Uncharacterized protein n=1 Tax=Pleurodeles waltl TaxID=8319 RepID=A0AAV7LGT1_PLEWA|nr:hypothetical protein NDU88_003921 [Pleurodeles waltl]